MPSLIYHSTWGSFRIGHNGWSTEYNSSEEVRPFHGTKDCNCSSLHKEVKKKKKEFWINLVTISTNNKMNGISNQDSFKLRIKAMTLWWTCVRINHAKYNLNK